VDFTFVGINIKSPSLGASIKAEIELRAASRGILAKVPSHARATGRCRRKLAWRIGFDRNRFTDRPVERVLSSPSPPPGEDRHQRRGVITRNPANESPLHSCRCSMRRGALSGLLESMDYVNSEKGRRGGGSEGGRTIARGAR